MNLGPVRAAEGVAAAFPRERLAALRRLWPWLPLLFAAAYVVVLAATFKSLVQGLYQNADLAAAPVIGELYPQAPPGAEVVLTNFPWYTTLWFEQLTHGLPAHRQIWQVGPWLFSLVGVGLVAWSASRAAGRWAGAMAAIVLACAGPPLLLWQFAGSGHATTFVHVCVLGAFLVLCAARAGGLVGGPRVHAAVCAGVAAITAAGVASDNLFLLAGITPFVLAGLALRWQLAPPAGRRVATSAVLVAAAGVAGGYAIRWIMEAQDVHGTHFNIKFAEFDRLAVNFRLFAQSIVHLFNGDFAGQSIEARGLLAFACAVAAGVALLVVVRLGRDWWRAEAASPRPAPRAAGDARAARLAHVTFWLLAATFPALGFVFSSVPVDVNTSRYLVTVAYAVAALVPLVVARGTWSRALVVAGVCVIVAGSIRGLAARDIQDNGSRFPTGSVSGPLLRLARAEHVKYGYAGYWDAMPLTWQMKAAVQIYPVLACPGGRLCQFGVHHISSWYVPRPGTRTLLVTDQAPFDRAVVSPPPGLGPPDRVVKIGQLTVYIYPYDLASKIAKVP